MRPATRRCDDFPASGNRSNRGLGLLILATLFQSATATAERIHADGFEESCLVDTDDDRLSNCDEAMRGLSYFDEDTDDDGLPDGDEVLGTAAGLDLPAFGVNPRHKDMLVEMDWTDEAFECLQHSHRPLAQTIDEIKIFYAGIPVSNPDGISGINFVADYGQGGPFEGGNFIAIPDGITSKLEGPFHQYKATNFAVNRAGYFRYQIHGHRWAYGNPSSGYGDVGGDNSVITLRCLNSSNNVRNTVIHELGHNLGLHHGGNTPCNRKPDYNSLMNYEHQFPGLDTNCDRYGDGIDNLGYSDGTRNALTDGQLIETQGVCAADHPLHKAIDWNSNGLIEASPVSLAAGQVLATECAQIDAVADFDDYAALILPPVSPHGGGAAPPADPSGACPAPLAK